MTDHLAPPASAGTAANPSNAKITVNGHDAASPSDGHGAVRPIAPVGAATQRDIQLSEQGQHKAPKGPTRIATWRPIPGQSIIKPEFTPNPSQSSQIAELKEYTERELTLKPSDGELYENYGVWEKRFLDRPDTYSRYMRAADWKMDNAKKRIQETLEWRRTYQPDLIKPEEIRKEAEGGKVVVNGFDREGRPIVWLRPSRENTKPSPAQIRHLIFQLERAIDLLPPGVEKLALVVDYKGATSSNNPSLKTVKEVIYILQNHYVERLGKGVVVNVPFYLSGFFNLIKKLLDPKTKSKVAFNPKLESLIPIDQLDSEFIGGAYNYIYDSNVYLPALCHFCGVKEDGTREDLIPVKDLPSETSEKFQRTLTQRTGDTAEEEAEYARREAEAQARQDREAEEYAKRGGEMPIEGDDDSTTALALNDADSIGTGNDATTSTIGAGTTAALGGAALAGTAAAGVAANRASTQDPSTATTAAHSTGSTFTTLDNVQMRPKDSTTQLSTTDTKVATAATAAPTPAANTAAPLSTSSYEGDSSAAAPAPAVVSSTTTAAPPTSNGPLAASPKSVDGNAPPLSPTSAPAPAAEPAPTSVTTREPTSPTRPVPASEVTPALVAQTETQPVLEVLAAPGRKRGGWKLFSSKRGLDKQGNPSIHKHKHISKALCMHKGAIDPSWVGSQESNEGTRAPTEKLAVPAGTGSATDDGSAARGAPSDGRVKIAPEALEGREERTYTNAPLATNATLGPDAYHTAMEAYPTGDDNEGGGGDYFTDMRKIPPVKPATVDDQHKDPARMVSRPTEIMNRLHEGGTGDLVLAFEVKQPPVDEEKIATKEDADGNGEAGEPSLLTALAAKAGFGQNSTKAT